MVDDETLFARWCDNNDEAAGHQLLQSYRSVIYKFFSSKCPDQDLVDDLVQETFFVCLRGRHAARQDEPFNRFLMRIARNVLLGYLRRRSSDDPRVAVEGPLPDPIESSDEGLPRTAQRVRLLQALNALPVEQKVLLELYYRRELRLDELAEVLHLPAVTVRIRLIRARQALLASLARINAEHNAGDAELEAWAMAPSSYEWPETDLTSLWKVVLHIRNELGEKPWAMIAEALHNTMTQDPSHELTLPEIEALAERWGFVWQDVHVVVEKLAQGHASFLERQFFSMRDNQPAVVSPDEVAERLRAGMEHERAWPTWEHWARNVRVVWRLRRQDPIGSAP